MHSTLSVSRRVATIVVSAFVTLAVSAASLRAAIVTYAPPAIVGANVSYTAVSESSTTDPVPLYGTPTLSGNNLAFTNMNFGAASVNAVPGIDLTDGQINFTIQAHQGTFLQTIALQEFGDYNIFSTPGSGAVNFVKVFPQNLQITVLDINGVPLGTPLVNNTSVAMTLAPSGGDFQTGIDPATGSWQGSALANLAALFASNNITRVAISYDNQLLAQSQVGGIATIAKKGFTIIPTTVPEPIGASMLLIVAGCGAMARRRRII